jgi:transcription antitermination factor NusA-like protein
MFSHSLSFSFVSKKSISLRTPICNFDAMNGILCPQCESKLDQGILTKADIEASIKLVKLSQKIPQIEKFTLYSCRRSNGDYVLYLGSQDIMIIRQSRDLYRIIQGEFTGKIWLVHHESDDKKFIEDVFFPIKILAINQVWALGGLRKTKVVVSGKKTPRFPIDIDKIIAITHDLRKIKLVVEFERK